jgi:hypothetical protein
MATGVRLYKSTDTSAPTLTGQTGSLTTLLDAVLVNGYGSQSAAGSSPGAGAWTIPFTGTSQRAYRPAAGNQFYLSIIDNGPGAGTFKEARVVSYETMSALNTGTNPMPTVAQFSTGLVIRKSATADATARPWICLADDRMLIFLAQTGDTASTYLGWMWGDFYSHLSGDGYRTAIIGRTSENSATTSGGSEPFSNLTGSGGAANIGHYVQRNRSGTVGALQIGNVASPSLNDSTSVLGSGTNTIAYPNGEDGGLYLMPQYIIDPTTAPSKSIRGRYRGIWHNAHPPASFSDADTFSGVTDYVGKSFLVVKSVGTGGVCILETSDTLDTSS